MKKQIERRVHAQHFEVRGSDNANDKAKISGYAAVFDSPSEDLGYFRESIDPHAFDTVMATAPDVRALFNHDPNLILGRTKAGTLALSLDARGLAYTIDPPDTQLARDLITSMQRGDVTQSSYAFIVARDQWTDEADGTVSRRILEIEELFDVSPVTYPGFTATSAEVQSRVPRSMPAEMRSKLQARGIKLPTVETRNEDCECECTECVSGNCAACSDPDCNDPACEGTRSKAKPGEASDPAAVADAVQRGVAKTLQGESDTEFRERLHMRLRLALMQK